MHITNKPSIINRFMLYATFIVDWHKGFHSLKENFILHCINQTTASVVVVHPPPLAHSHPPSLTTSRFLHFTMDIV